MYRIKELEIRNFRGFREARFRIPDVDIVLVAGGNGFGKSSFFDAIEWGLTGSLRRYAESNQEKSSEIFLTNRYSTSPGQVKMILSDGREEFDVLRETEIRRGNDFNEGKLCGRIQADLEQILVKEPFVGKYDFTRIFSFSHLLSQGLIDEFVRGFKAKDRYDVLSQLIGIGDYLRYRDTFRLLERDVRKRVETLRGEMFSLQKDQEKYRELANQESANREGKILHTERWVRRYNDLMELLEPGFGDRQPGRVTDHRDMEPAFARLNALQSVYANRFAEQQSGYQKLTALASRVPAHNDLLRQRGQFEDERRRLEEQMAQLEKLAVLNRLADHFEIYRNRQQNALRLATVESAIKQSEMVLQILNRSELETADLLLVLTKTVSDSTLQSYAAQIRERQDECRSLEEQWKTLNQMQLELDHLETDILHRALDYFLLTPEMKHCPVCRGTIDSRLLVSELRARIAAETTAAGKEHGERRQRLHTELTEARERYDVLLTVIQDHLREWAVAQRDVWQALMAEKARLEEVMEATGVMENRLAAEGIGGLPEEKQFMEIQQRKAVLQDLITSLNLSPERIQRRFTELERLEEEAADRLMRIERDCQRLGIDEITGPVLAQALHDMEETMAATERQSARLEELAAEMEAVRRQMQSSENRRKLRETEEKLDQLLTGIHTAEALQRDLQELESKVPAIVEKMTAEILDHYKETVNEFLHLLDPQPFFTRLDWEVSHSHFHHGALVLQSISADGQYRMNPTFTYSSAQINLIALAFFLSFAVQQHWSHLDCMFMDDPIQNMDDINIFGFVDLIRALCLNGQVSKQIFISTHDRKFVSFMLKKFRMLRVFLIDYKGYGERGPVIETKMYEPRIRP